MTRVLLLCLMFSACGGSDESESSASTNAAPIAPGTPSAPGAPAAPGQGTAIAPSTGSADVLSVAGDAAVTYMLRLDRWSETMATLRALAGSGLPSEMVPMLSMDRPEALLAMLDVPDAEAISQMRGLDRSRPMIVRQGESEGGLARAMQVLEGQRTSLRHVIVLPASDSAALARSVASVSSRVCQQLASPMVRRCGPHQNLGIYEHGAWVLAVFAEHVPDSVDELLGAPQRGGTLAWAMADERPVSLHVDMSKLRDLSIFTEAQMRRRTGGGLFAHAVQSMMETYIRLSPMGVEFSSMALSLRSSPPSLLAVAQLTPVMQERVQMGNTPGPFVHEGTHPIITVRSSYDLNAMARGGSDAFSFSQANSPRDVMRPLQSREPVGALRVLAEPFGFAHTVLRIGAGEMEPFVTIRRVPMMAPGTLDIELDVQALANQMHERELEAIARGVPRLHLHSQIQGNMWAGALGHTTNLPLVPATPGAPIEAPNFDQKACAEELVNIALSADADAAQALSTFESRRSCATHPAVRRESLSYLQALRRLPDNAHAHPGAQQER